MRVNRVLVIDDEESVLNAVSRVLKDEGYDLVMCLDTEKGEKEFNKEPFDVIICDQRMENMDCVTFLGNMKKKYPWVKTILFAGNTDFQMAIDAVNKAAIDKLIVKPWNNEEFKATIKEMVEDIEPGPLNKIVAEDIMSMFAITVKEEASLVEASHLMLRFKISGLPVVESSGKIIGIITATDLFQVMGETIKEGETSPNAKTIGDVMTKEVFTVEKRSKFYDVISLMLDKNIHTLPVVEDNEIVGIIGRRDVLNTYYKLFS